VEIAIDPQHRRYLNSKVRSGHFKSPSDVVKHALERLKEDERDAEWLKREFKEGLDALDRGDVSDWNLEAQKARLVRRIQRNQKRKV
jgi:putative addiction module CopG family antidote